MSDALQRLAPPILPQTPVVEAATGAGWAVFLIAGVALAALTIWLIPRARRLWRRHQLRLALASLRRNDAKHSATAQAQALAGLVRRFHLTPPEHWWAETDAIRFGRPANGSSARIDTLIAALENDRGGVA